MANYAVDTCFRIENWPSGAIETLKRAIKIVEDGGETPDTSLSDLPSRVRNLVQNVLEDYDTLGFSIEKIDDTSWLVKSEDGMFSPDRASELLYEIMKSHSINGIVIAPWSCTCDKHRPEAFSGGAAVISNGYGEEHDGVRFIDAKNWAYDQAEHIRNTAIKNKNKNNDKTCESSEDESREDYHNSYKP